MPQLPDIPDHASEEERILAALAHGSTLLGVPVFGPLAIFLWKKDESNYVGFHAKQAMVGQMVMLAVITVIALFTCGVGALLFIPWMLYELWLAWEAWQGRWSSYPMLETVGKEFG